MRGTLGEHWRAGVEKAKEAPKGDGTGNWGGVMAWVRAPQSCVFFFVSLRNDIYVLFLRPSLFRWRGRQIGMNCRGDGGVGGG